MRKNKQISVRIEPELKETVELIFSQLGLNISQAIDIFFRQVQINNGLPFDMRLPDDNDIKLLKQARKARKEGFIGVDESEQYINEVLK